MYSIGDLILYGNTGVCRIEDIVEKEMTGSGKSLYYAIKPIYHECLIYTPVDNNKVFMRHVISKEEAERLIDLIPNIQAEAYQSNAMRELVEHYEESFKTHKCEDLIELTMSIYAKKQLLESKKKKFGAVDERFMKKAEDLLFGELAVALDIPRSEVQEYISKRIEAAKK